MGFGAPGFDGAVEGISVIHRKLAGLYKVGDMEPYVPSKQGDCVELNFSNRYVTPKAYIQNNEPILAFGPDVDPKNVLRDWTAGVGHHLDDNVVKYFSASFDKE